MAALDKIRLSDGTVLRPGDWTASPYYSSVDFTDDAAVSAVDAFSYGIGGDVPITSGASLRKATLADTNMQGGGGILAETEALLIYGLSIELIQGAADTTDFFTGGEVWAPDPPLLSATNVARIHEDVIVKLMIASTKNYFQAPIGFFPTARGVDFTLGSARSQGSGYAEGVLVGTNGGVSQGDQRLFATPHEVLPGEQFGVRFEFPRGAIRGLDFGADTGAYVTARTFQIGLRLRPVA